MLRRRIGFESLERRTVLTTFFVEAGADGDGSANSPFGSIQDAVEAAAELPGNDKIMIASGVYEENIDIDDDDSVSLLGQGDVIIQHPELADGEETEDIIKSKGDGDLRIQNITVLAQIEGDDSRGLDLRDGSVTLINVNVEAVDDDAVRVRDFDKLTVRNGSFTSLGSDGLDLEDGGTVVVINVEANNNDNEGLEVDRTDSVTVIGGNFNGNGDDGIDIDSTREIRVVNVTAMGNGDFDDEDGNGLQVEAENDDFVISNVTVIGGTFEGNAQNGVQIVEDGSTIESVVLIGNASNDNTLSGYEIDISGAVVGRGNRANGNGDDSLPG